MESNGGDNGKRYLPEFDDDIGSQTTNDILSNLMRRKRPKMTQNTTENIDQPGNTQNANEDYIDQGDDEDNSDDDSDDDSEASSDDDSDEDSDEDQGGPNRLPTQAGVIERIILKNFMCHESFELELGPRLNFIIGRNGSGKSAIITGISVGLGAKASDTSRGSSITDLIKDGKSTARIIITFKNNGVDGYYPEKYGDKITIERKLSRESNNSNYTVKDSHNKTFLTKKSEIDEILSKYNIRVDNPLSFLSQDKAREFLTSTTDEAKFKYFMDGVLITDIINHHKETSNNTNEIRGKLDIAKENQKIAKERYDDSVRIYKKFKKSEDIRKRLDLIQGKIFWYNVKQLEVGLNKYETIMSKNQQEIDLINETIKSNELSNQELVTEIQKFRNKLIHIDEEFNEIKLKFKENKSEIDKINTDKESYEQEINRNNEIIDSNNKLVEKLNDDIKHEQSKIDQINGGSNEELNTKIKGLEVEIENLKQQKNTKDLRLRELESESINSEIQLKTDEIKELESLILGLKEKLKMLNDSKRDRYISWGAGMKNLVSAINSINDWHMVPLGPIGSLVNVKKKYADWKDLINSVLSRTLDSFLVCDEHDRKKLIGLLQKFKIRKNVIVRKFETFDYSNGKPSKDLVNFIDMLEFFDENILYTLIDMHSIEKSIITNNQTMASSLITQNNVQNVYSLFDRNSGQRSTGDGSSFNVDPVFYNLRAPHKLSGGMVIENINEEINKCENLISDRRDEIATLNRQVRQLKINLEKEKTKLSLDINEINKSINKITNQITEIETGLDESIVSNKIDSLKAQIDDALQQNKNCENILISLSEDFVKTMDILKLKKAKYKELINQSNEIENTKKVIEDKIDNMTNDLTFNETQDGKLNVKIRGLEKSIEESKLKYDSHRPKLDLHRARAEEICSREDITINEGDSKASIEAEFHLVKQALEEADKAVGRNYEDIQNEVITNGEISEKADKQVEDLGKLYTSIQSDLQQRLSFLLKTISMNIQEAKTSFEYALDVRKYKGKLIFDNQNRKITMLVAPQEATQVRTVDSLSGGEKSFTQIAFLLSIWKIMNSKIRGLDEFDVFMDSMNRTASIQLLLAELKKSPNSQTIFITPQDITSIANLDNEDVRIHKMSSPRDD